LFILSLFAWVGPAGCAVSSGSGHARTGVNRLDATQLRQIDQRVRDFPVQYNYINVALVRAREVAHDFGKLAAETIPQRSGTQKVVRRL